jgi:hypothetical protein
VTAATATASVPCQAVPRLRTSCSPILLAALLIAAGCSATRAEGREPAGSASTPAADENAASATTAAPVAAPPTAAPATTAPVTTVPPTVPETTSPPTTSSTTTTTTTTLPPLDVYDPACVVRVVEGDSLDLIAARFDDETVSGPSIQVENALPDLVIAPDQLLDVCVDNGVNDITGVPILERNSVVLSMAVTRQQEHLNTLFAGLGIRELLVDGISGPVTRQRLCAARLALGLPVSTEDMVPGSEEEQTLFATTTLPVPFTSAILSPRWVLIDRTCQIMFAGEGTERLTFVFPTSTGEAGHETRDQDLQPVRRFNPALDNNGWHNSTSFPVAEDNPLNGNMYKPLYFDGGQAIHGANNVPTSPQSKGCARLRVEHMDMLLFWLGLGAPTTSISTINLTVNVQGTWVPR